MDHELYMRRAIEIARGNPEAPFGCIIVRGGTGEILAEGLNDAERSPVLHGETAAVMDLFEKDSGADSSDLVLYTTAEPCPMCAGAILWSGIPEVIVGTGLGTIKDLGLPHVDVPCDEVSARASFDGFAVERGVLEDECDALYEEMSRRL